MKKINRKQVWKFFWKQKLEELKNFIFYTLLVGIGLYSLNFLGRWYDLNINENGLAEFLIQTHSNNFVAYLVYGLTGLLMLAMIIAVIGLIYEFFKSNWEKAEEKARSGK